MIRTHNPYERACTDHGSTKVTVATICIRVLALAVVLALAGPVTGAVDQPDSVSGTEVSPDRDKRLYLGAGFGYSRTDTRLYRPDGTYKASGHGFNDGLLRAGYHLDPHWAIEVGYQSWDEDGGEYKQIDLKLMTAGVAWYSGGPFARLELAYGRVKTVIGVTDLTGPPEPPQVVAVESDVGTVGIAAGVGYRFFLAKSLTLTLEAEGAWLPRHQDVTTVYGTINAVLGYFVW